MKWTTQKPTESGFYWVKWIEVEGTDPVSVVASVRSFGGEHSPDEHLGAMFYDEFLPIDSPVFVAWSDAAIPKPEE